MRHIINCEVNADKNLDFEKMLKKFNKKVKKSNILAEHVEKTLYFKTRSQKLRAKRLRNKFIRAKLENGSRYCK